ncbi:MAG: host-nuclease inhibitor Gam family protein [Rhodoblastus sp.]
MAKQPKSKTRAANLAVPQNADEATAFIGRIGIAERMVARIEHDMNDQIAKIKQASEEAAAGYIADSKALTEGLRIYCDANRDKLTDGGKVKFHQFGTGKVEWRHLPPSVRMKTGVKAEDVIAWCEAQEDHPEYAERFVRTKKELDKDALRSSPMADDIPGIIIGSAGEQFTVAPVELQIEGGK